MKKEYPDILKLEGEKWHNPDPATGKLGTRVPAEWLQTTEDSLKSLTLEMLEVLKAAGINPNELNNTQVRDAIQKMILSRVINYNDIVGRPIVKDSLGDDRNNPASQRVVNDVNRAANNAQTSANIANDKANTAQTTANQAKSAAETADSKAVKAQNRADNAYSLAESKVDKAYIDQHGIGYEQKWVDVTKVRAKLTTYTNNTNKPIFVAILGGDNRGNAVRAYVDDISVGYFTKTSPAIAASVSFVVPVGSTYKIEDYNFSSWSELR